MYKVGTRVKKVRDAINVGITGVVVDRYLPPDRVKEGYDMVVKVDRACVDRYGHALNAGTAADARSKNWEPIIPEGSDVPATYTVEQLLSGKVFSKDAINVD